MGFQYTQELFFLANHGLWMVLSYACLANGNKTPWKANNRLEHSPRRNSEAQHPVFILFQHGLKQPRCPEGGPILYRLIHFPPEIVSLIWVLIVLATLLEHIVQ